MYAYITQRIELGSYFSIYSYFSKYFNFSYFSIFQKFQNFSIFIFSSSLFYQIILWCFSRSYYQDRWKVQYQSMKILSLICDILRLLGAKRLLQSQMIFRVREKSPFCPWSLYVLLWNRMHCQQTSAPPLCFSVKQLLWRSCFTQPLVQINWSYKGE